MRILVADDEREITKAICAVLVRQNYTVDVVDNGADALDYALSGAYDCIVLDIMMPDQDGLSVLRELRSAGIAAPVLLLTARGELEDRVTGLEAGADDYLPKPYAMTELLARIKALLRRSGGYAAETVTVGKVCLNCSSYALSSPTATVKLNNKEFQIMELFMRNPRRVFSIEDIMESVGAGTARRKSTWFGQTSATFGASWRSWTPTWKSVPSAAWAISWRNGHAEASAPEVHRHSHAGGAHCVNADRRRNQSGLSAHQCGRNRPYAGDHRLQSGTGSDVRAGCRAARPLGLSNDAGDPV